jgi:hypothetical protein
MTRLFTSILIILALIGCSNKKDTFNRWIEIEPGLLLGVFKVSSQQPDSESDIEILKIDPHHFDINIYTSSQYSGQARSLSKWAEDFDLVAATNAGMFATDFSTSIGFLKSGDHINNPVINGSHKCIFACQPVDSIVAPVKLIDLNCEEYEQWEDKYSSFSQSIRMISCDQQNVWEPKDEKWNIAALGVDTTGHLLLIYSSTPFSVHELINHLLEMPIAIENAMYLEGGFQAGLYLSSGSNQRDFRDYSKSPLIKAEDSPEVRTIPNIIGVKRSAARKP